MNTNAETDLTDEQAKIDYAGQRGEKWVQHHAAEFKRLPKGTIVAINCRTGEYIAASTRLEAMDAYERRFGKDIGYVHEIGGGIFVGRGEGIV
jgi:hypothetical protein